MPNDRPLILHVDDDDDILAIAKLALETVGALNVVQCSSGQEALEIASDKLPDLFLLDVMMPEIDGMETLRRLRNIQGFEQTPAIFMTAKVSPENEKMLLECGAVSVIKKPFDPMTLASEIVEIWKVAFQAGTTKQQPT